MIGKDRAVSIRYASSLFELAKEQASQDAVLSELESVLNIFKENPDLANILTNPRIAVCEKHAIIDKIFKDRVSLLVTNFLKLLLDKNRLMCLADAFTSYRGLYLKDKNVKEVDVTVAFGIDTSIYNKLKEAVENFTGSKALLRVWLDHGIIGGVILTLDGQQIDMSIRNKLSILRQRFKETKV